MSKKKPQRLKRRRLQRTAKPTVDQSASELFAQGQFLDGLRLLDDAVDRGTDTAMTWSLIGRGLVKLKEYAQAIGALQRAIERRGDDAETQYDLAEASFQLGDVPRAVELFESVARTHDHLNAWCNLATIIPGDPTASNQRIRAIRTEYAARLSAAEPIGRDENLPQADPSPRLRIGYVSAFFPNENYMKPVWQLIRSHDRTQFEVHLFADDADQADFDWLESPADDHIHLTTRLSNPRLADLIRNQQLDVLIDLNAYSVPWRLSLYTGRLAPLVAAWFNMYGTSGFPGIDCIIGDQVVAPESEDDHYTEQVVRLPQSYLSFDVDYATPDIVPAPSIASGHLTFGSLISQYKITPEVYDAWARILNGAPDSRLLLGNRALASPCNRDHAVDQFRRRGIDPGRIGCLPPADHREFLKYYDRIDLALDAFPYNGGTTTTEAIWQGVPTLAIYGDRWAARTSATLLINGGLSEFVTDSIDDYVARAIDWASGSDRFAKLGQIRLSMRDRLRQSPVCDTRSMVQHFENSLLRRVARFAPPSGSDRPIS